MLPIKIYISYNKTIILILIQITKIIIDNYDYINDAIVTFILFDIK